MSILVTCPVDLAVYFPKNIVWHIWGKYLWGTTTLAETCSWFVCCAKAAVGQMFYTVFKHKIFQWKRHATSCAATSRNHLFSHKYSHQASTIFRPFIFSFYVLAFITWNAFVFSTKYWYFFAWGTIYFRRKHSHPNCKADGDGNVVFSSIFGICSVSNFLYKKLQENRLSNW